MCNSAYDDGFSAKCSAGGAKQLSGEESDGIQGAGHMHAQPRGSLGLCGLSTNSGLRQTRA